MQPDREIYYCEYLRSLYRLGMYQDIVEHGELHRGGGYGRYLIARSELALGLDQRSLRLLSDTLLLDPDDSVSSDAALWLSILLDGSVGGDSILSLARLAVDAAPDPGCFEITRLADACLDEGLLEEARLLLFELRLAGEDGDYYYWSCMAELAREEQDPERRVWASRRALECRETPSSEEQLAWALLSSAEEGLEDGNLLLAATRLSEACSLEWAGEEVHERASSLLDLLEEYERGMAER
jgi:hypothetical protein